MPRRQSVYQETRCAASYGMCRWLEAVPPASRSLKRLRAPWECRECVLPTRANNPTSVQVVLNDRRGKRLVGLPLPVRQQLLLLSAQTANRLRWRCCTELHMQWIAACCAACCTAVQPLRTLPPAQPVVFQCSGPGQLCAAAALAHPSRRSTPAHCVQFARAHSRRGRRRKQRVKIWQMLHITPASRQQHPRRLGSLQAGQAEPESGHPAVCSPVSPCPPLAAITLGMRAAAWRNISSDSSAAEPCQYMSGCVDPPSRISDPDVATSEAFSTSRVQI